MKPDLNALLIHADDKPGVLHMVTKKIAERGGNISSVEIVGHQGHTATLYLEITEFNGDITVLIEELGNVSSVTKVESFDPLLKVYGKRIIIIGGGAQIGQVALGAISEADRHNLRGERISVDTIPLVEEKNLASAVRAVAFLPRAKVLVMAGAIMGGEITNAVKEIKQDGITVISLNMAGSVPQEADLVVSDPVQAGVMAVMAVADTAQFDITLQRSRQY